MNPTFVSCDVMYKRIVCVLWLDTCAPVCVLCILNFRELRTCLFLLLSSFSYDRGNKYGKLGTATVSSGFARPTLLHCEMALLRILNEMRVSCVVGLG